MSVSRTQAVNGYLAAVQAARRLLREADIDGEHEASPAVLRDLVASFSGAFYAALPPTDGTRAEFERALLEVLQ